ncbi:myo-inositol-1-monophosphatase [Enterovibrio norvegicus FF-454]|uniref:Myo-inositol-1-monophosphatase n=1 Tax=Enterovibrio norvegicus FF-454 TaxID=1185651 RepID=A0A1E5C9J4_9GAMM|nr:inositol monophosphatase [Enterovibrio norvegicus]OEE62193.1 myo-inositol-1-monophosphatase [Enterovibrio norvegicus FF-454]
MDCRTESQRNEVLTHDHVEQLLNMSIGTAWQVLRDIVSQAAQDIMLPKFALNAYQQEVSHKEDDSLVTLADKQMQQRLIKTLTSYWPDIPVLGEEQTSQQHASVITYLDSAAWVLDPIDGTGNFAAGIPYFCTSLALVVESKVVLSLVHDPNRDESFFAFQGSGAHLNGQILRPRVMSNNSLNHASALIDFKRLPTNLASILAIDPPYRSQRSFGASALDWCWIAASRCQVYLHGSQMLWDYAAGELILREAGGCSSSFDGKAVFEKSLAPRSVIAAIDPDCYRQWRDWLNGRGDLRLKLEID